VVVGSLCIGGLELLLVIAQDPDRCVAGIQQLLHVHIGAVVHDRLRLQREAQASIENGFEGSSLIRIDPILSARAQRAHLGAGVDIEDENLVLMLVGLVAASMAGLLGVTFAISGSVQLLVGILSVDASLMLGSLPSLIIGALLIWLAVWAIRRIVRTMKGKRSHTALRLTTPELVRQR
jgi:hypothetical protein